MASGEERPAPAVPGRGLGVWVEDALIWASLLALWPRLLRGRWIFTGWWVNALLWAALAAMLIVAARRVWRIARGNSGKDGHAG